MEAGAAAMEMDAYFDPASPNDGVAGQEVGRRMGQALAAKRLQTTLYNEQNMCRLFPHGYPYFDVLFDVPQRL